MGKTTMIIPMQPMTIIRRRLAISTTKCWRLVMATMVTTEWKSSTSSQTLGAIYSWLIHIAGNSKFLTYSDCTVAWSIKHFAFLFIQSLTRKMWRNKNFKKMKIYVFYTYISRKMSLTSKMFYSLDPCSKQLWIF